MLALHEKSCALINAPAQIDKHLVGLAHLDKIQGAGGRFELGSWLAADAQPSMRDLFRRFLLAKPGIEDQLRRHARIAAAQDRHVGMLPPREVGEDFLLHGREARGAGDERSFPALRRLSASSAESVGSAFELTSRTHLVEVGKQVHVRETSSKAWHCHGATSRYSPFVARSLPSRS